MKQNKSKRGNNKGFSLVELIVVMAIMAILVGAVAPQVIKYVEKARESKDLQVVNTVFAAVQTTISSSETTVSDIDNQTLDQLATTYSGTKFLTTLNELLGTNLNTTALVKAKCVSSKGTAGTLYVDYDPTTGTLKVYIAASAGGTATIGPVTN